MTVEFRVTGRTPAELEAEADKVAAGFADGASYTVELGPVHEDAFDPGGTPVGAARVFSVYVTAEVG